MCYQLHSQSKTKKNPDTVPATRNKINSTSAESTQSGFSGLLFFFPKKQEFHTQTEKNLFKATLNYKYNCFLLIFRENSIFSSGNAHSWCGCLCADGHSAGAGHSQPTLCGAFLQFGFPPLVCLVLGSLLTSAPSIFSVVQNQDSYGVGGLLTSGAHHPNVPKVQESCQIFFDYVKNTCFEQGTPKKAQKERKRSS